MVSHRNKNRIRHGSCPTHTNNSGFIVQRTHQMTNKSLNSHNIATSYRIRRSHPILVVTAKRGVQWNITGIRIVHLSRPRMTKNKKTSLRFRLSSHWLLIDPTKSPPPMSKISSGFEFKSSVKVLLRRKETHSTRSSTRAQHLV